MSRPLRLEYPGSLWHVTARGNERRPIFIDDDDRRKFLHLLGRCVDRTEWILLAYVLMPNHFHLLIQLRAETLSRGMKWLNGTYSQIFNLRHERVGHLFQGRFKALLVDKESYFLEVLRYIVLNPVRAGIVAKPEDYAWSSHRAVLGAAVAPEWLAVDDALVSFAPERDIARASYCEFVRAGIGQTRSPWDGIRGQIYLGSETWIDGVRERIALKPRADEHPRSQRLPRTMADVIAAVARAWGIDPERIRHKRGGIPRMVAAWIGWNQLLTNSEIAAALRMRSSGHVSNLIRQCEQQLACSLALRVAVDRCLSTMGGNYCKAKV